VSEPLPLFPLGTVLFPGALLPLHVFEERYRLLVGELVARPDGEPKQFGVVALREGREVGPVTAGALHRVGCIAELRRVQAYDDGRFDIVTTGGARFAIAGVDTDRPYLVGDVEFLHETSGEDADLLVAQVQGCFLRYLEALGTARGEPIDVPDLPTDPLLLSYLIAATALLDLGDKQRLLEAQDATDRLRLEARMLRRETTLLTEVGIVPSPDQTRTGPSPN
jgi:uncharacterized protein